MILYKGAAPNSYWHQNDPRINGHFAAARPRLATSASRMVKHIAEASNNSPFVSFTYSFAVATEYALDGATETNRGRVYEVDFSVLSGDREAILFDPVHSICKHFNWVHNHDGGQDLIVGIADPLRGDILEAYPRRPPTAPQRFAKFDQSLEALVRAIRDSEVLTVSFTLADGMINAYDLY